MGEGRWQYPGDHHPHMTGDPFLLILGTGDHLHHWIEDHLRPGKGGSHLQLIEDLGLLWKTVEGLVHHLGEILQAIPPPLEEDVSLRPDSPQGDNMRLLPGRHLELKEMNILVSLRQELVTFPLLLVLLLIPPQVGVQLPLLAGSLEDRVELQELKLQA